MMHLLKLLVQALKAYIQLLETELDRTASLLKVHGWEPSKEDAARGAKARAEVQKREAAIKAPTQGDIVRINRSPINFFTDWMIDNRLIPDDLQMYSWMNAYIEGLVKRQPHITDEGKEIPLALKTSADYDYLYKLIDLDFYVPCMVDNQNLKTRDLCQCKKIGAEIHWSVRGYSYETYPLKGNEEDKINFIEICKGLNVQHYG